MFVEHARKSGEADELVMNGLVYCRTNHLKCSNFSSPAIELTEDVQDPNICTGRAFAVLVR